MTKHCPCIRVRGESKSSFDPVLKNAPPHTLCPPPPAPPASITP